MRRRSLLALSALLLVTVLSSPSYAVSIIDGPVVYNNHTYYKLAQSDWFDAEAEAITLGGHLVTINDAAENAFILATFAETNDALWIGLNDAASEGNFVWVSGEPVTYENWADGEPNDAPPLGEDYGTMLPLTAPVDGTWNDVHESQNLNFGIIEVPVPEPSTALLVGLGMLGMALRRKGALSCEEISTPGGS